MQKNTDVTIVDVSKIRPCSICQLSPILIQVHKQQKAVSEGVRTPFKPIIVTANEQHLSMQFGYTRIIGISLQEQSWGHMEYWMIPTSWNFMHAQNSCEEFEGWLELSLIPKYKTFFHAYLCIYAFTYHMNGCVFLSCILQCIRLPMGFVILMLLFNSTRQCAVVFSDLYIVHVH